MVIVRFYCAEYVSICALCVASRSIYSHLFACTHETSRETVPHKRKHAQNPIKRSELGHVTMIHVCLRLRAAAQRPARGAALLNSGRACARQVPDAREETRETREVYRTEVYDCRTVAHRLYGTRTAFLFSQFSLVLFSNTDHVFLPHVTHMCRVSYIPRLRSASHTAPKRTIMRVLLANRLDGDASCRVERDK